LFNFILEKRKATSNMRFLGSLTALFATLALGRADICDVCGQGQVVTKPDEIVSVGTQPPIACGTLEANGLAGQVDTAFCGLIPSLIGPTCGCEDAGPMAPVYPTTMSPVVVINKAPSSTAVPGSVTSAPNTIAPISGATMAPVSVSPVVASPETSAPVTVAPALAPVVPVTGAPVVTPVVDPSNAPIEAPVANGSDGDDDDGTTSDKAPKMKDDKQMKEKKHGKDGKVGGDKKGGKSTHDKGHNVKGNNDKATVDTDEADESAANTSNPDTDAADGNEVDEVLPDDAHSSNKKGESGDGDGDDDDDDSSSSPAHDKGGKKVRRKVDKVRRGGNSKGFSDHKVHYLTSPSHLPIRAHIPSAN
jgi:hypothetical protein